LKDNLPPAKKENGMTVGAKTIKSQGRKPLKSEADRGNRKGLSVERKFTHENVSPFDSLEYEIRSSVITNPDGSIVFRMDQIEVPKTWSQLATDIVVSKYFRKAGVPGLGHETSVKQVVYRIAHTIRKSGENLGGYFASEEDANAFEHELTYLLITQRVAFNSPVWFNCGLYHEYQIAGSGGNWYWDPQTETIEKTQDSYLHPQCSACFIQSVGDDLMSIFELVKSEARLFKFGSGTGTNFSKIRGKQEKLSGGGTSSGLMSFLEVLDKGAGATKSGGTTRRAAKMVCLDMDHPEIADFINWKVREEKKVRALIAAGYSSDFNGDAYRTVSGQNSNNSVRITDEFMQTYLKGGKWQTKLRTTGEVCDTYDAREMMHQISYAAWMCADPGVQFDTTINDWHPCSNTDRIYASNPCSEYMFLDDTACNLASINLLKFLREDGSLDIEAYRHAVKIFIIAQEILVDFASYPTKKIAQNSHDYRPLGLGYANLGTLFMVNGIPYDSEEAYAICGAVTAIMTGHAYKVSAEISKSKGSFPCFQKNRESFMRVMNKHRAAAYRIDERFCPEDLLKAAREDWDQAVVFGERFAYRNAQATVIAPTGTIGLLMDCDTTGIEPDFALVKFKKLAGGGYFKIVNQSVPAALKKLGYSPREIEDIVTYVTGTASIKNTPWINENSLKAKGFTDQDLDKIERILPSVFDFPSAFNVWTLGEETYKRLNFKPSDYQNPRFNMLSALGFLNQEIEEANHTICGMMTVEGAPHLKEEHLAVFDCANKCGKYGKRFIAPMAHIKMMAAAQPFVSGSISKTVNLPNEVTVENIEDIYVQGWKLGLKSVALYRDGSKMSQPLNASSGQSSGQDKEETKSQPSVGVPTSSERRRLSKKRQGWTLEGKVGGHKVYLRTGEYDDGTLGEIFIDMHKEGAAFRSMMNCFAIAVSLGLQHGVPLKEFVDVFTFTRFEPQGMVDHPNIKQATSVIDYIFRVLGMEYLGRMDFVHKPVDPEGNVGALVSQETSRPAAQVSSNVKESPSHSESVKNEAKESGGNGNGVSQLSHEVVSSNAGRLHDASLESVTMSVLDEQLSQMMGDAPFCNICGHITVRSGSCYKCLNCGNSMGCS